MAKVMIVDDAVFMRTMIRHIVTEMGHEVVAEAPNGAEAVKLYTECRPDVVTMDITMPDMNGITAVTHIIEFDPAARIIMCSAMGQHRMVLDAIQAGAKDFIVKPLIKHRVMESIQNVLGQRM
ncbi:response regulator [Paenibacillus chartarius]|uniref:Response regulator n=1 Tax=Paenibacillus chartarius TaxID=747481 RepID=A0ABV6DRS6_9BACL